jgi:pilus assembly protein CpaF
MFDILLKDNKGKLLETTTCDTQSCTVGRSGRNLVALKGWRIATVHAEFSLQHKGLYIFDRSGGIGISVNGSPAPSFGPLHASDEIQIGAYRLAVRYDEPALSSSEPDHRPSPAPEQQEDIIPEEHVEQISPRQTVRTIGVTHIEHDEQPHQHSSRRFLWHNRIHQKLMLAMDLRRTDVESMDDDKLKETVQSLIKEIIESVKNDLPPEMDCERLAREVLNEAIGLGPLEELLADDSISEIMVNRFDDVYVERKGKLQKSEVTFSSDDAVRSVIERIVSPLGRRIDESSPMVDGRLKDGSRVNAIIPPLAIQGPTLTIRKFTRQKLQMQDLIEFGAISPAMASFLETAVTNRKNIVISGGTGSGKTTFLNVLSNYIPHTERIITVEDSAELRLGQPHVVSLEARPANMEGVGGITIRDLVKNCLRMRPDRIVVGECRGGEALDMLQAMNTGHDGSLTTVHANTPRDLISRLEVMVMMAGMDLPDRAIREQVTSAVHLVVQQARFADGTRKITHITEITGMESGMVQMQDIFVYKQHGFDSEGKVIGSFTATGRVPEFYENLKERGIPADMSLFAVNE